MLFCVGDGDEIGQHVLVIFIPEEIKMKYIYTENQNL